MPTQTTADDLLDEILQKNPQGAAPSQEQGDEQDPTKIKQRKPPSRGLCRRCGQNKPINRLMLCYACWVKTELEKQGWREGEPHPSSCDCEDVKDHPRRSTGN